MINLYIRIKKNNRWNIIILLRCPEMPKSNIEVRREAVTMCGTEVLNPRMMMFTYRFWFIYIYEVLRYFFLYFLHRCLLNYLSHVHEIDGHGLFQTKTEIVIGLLRRNGNKCFFIKKKFTSMTLQKAIFWDL